MSAEQLSHKGNQPVAVGPRAPAVTTQAQQRYCRDRSYYNVT